MEINEKASYPLVLVTILRIISRMPMLSPELLQTRLQERGVLVQIRQGSKYLGFEPGTEGVGQVVGTKEKEPGWTYVKFGKTGIINRYRIGLPSIADGACDLELASGEEEKFAVALYGGQLMEFPITGFAVEPGDTLKISREPLRVIGTEKGIASGGIAFVAEIKSDGLVLVDYQASRRTVFAGKYDGQLEQNGKVVLDSSGSVVVGNFGLDDDSFAVEDTRVTWDDICGQQKAKDAFINALEKPAQFPEHYAFFKKQLPHGVLLWGPPGCGKTLLAKALWTSMAATCKVKGVKMSDGFILISGAQILDKFVGVPEAAIRHIFARARRFYKKTGIPAIIVIEEADAILGKRDSGISSDILKTIVPTFLAEMQGVRESGAIVILTTNTPEALDQAIRFGRIDVFIEIDRPNQDAIRQIFVKNMKGIPVSDTTDLNKLADAFVEEMFSPKRVIYEITEADNAGGEDKVIPFTLANIVNGAMVPPAVEKAKELALKRELYKPKPTEGIRLEDIVAAVESIFRQTFSSNHEEAMKTFVHDFADRVRGIKKLIQAQN
jgi:proteasome-associated ATPase